MTEVSKLTAGEEGLSLLRQRSALEETGERSETSGGNSLHKSLGRLEPDRGGDRTVMGGLFGLGFASGLVASRCWRILWLG